MWFLRDRRDSRPIVDVGVRMRASRAREEKKRERERETTHHSGAGGSSDRLFLCRWSYQQQETKELMGNADCRSSTSLRGARPVAVSEFTTGAEWACAAHGDRLSVCAAG